jgi:drug/metabolite transporter (DMT)-like permease
VAESVGVFAAMLVTMLPMALWSGRRRRTRGPLAARSPSSWAWLFALGVSDALNALCFFGAMQRTSVALAVLTHYLTPLLVALLSPWVLREPAKRSTWGALALALAGLVLLLRPWAALGDDDVVGAALGAASAVFYAANVFVGKRLSGIFAPAEVAAWPKASSLAVLVAAAWATDTPLPSSSVIAVLLAGGVVFGALPTVLFYAGLARIAASQASVLTLMEPLVAVVVGVVVWGEALHPLGVVGAVGVLGAAFVIARAR